MKPKRGNREYVVVFVHIGDAPRAIRVLAGRDLSPRDVFLSIARRLGREGIYIGDKEFDSLSESVSSGKITTICYKWNGLSGGKLVIYPADKIPEVHV